MQGLGAVFRREFSAYFSTPLALIFLVIFLSMSGLFTFQIGGFFQRGQADLSPFFVFHPWLYLLLIPALCMRLWAEERRTGTIELLLTLPINTFVAVLGKFLAAWLFTGLALLLTTPLWITVSYLGDPDHGVIVAGYLSSWLMAAAYIAIGSCISAATNNQVIAFIVSAAVTFVFVLLGYNVLLDAFTVWAPAAVVDAVSALSFLTHFDALSRGVLDLRDIAFFIIMTCAWLLATVVVININKTH